MASIKPGDFNRFYEYYARTPEMQAASAETTRALAPPQTFSKTEVRATALAANIRNGGIRVFAEGDSWFNFPFFILWNPVSDLLDGLIHGHGYVVTRKSEAGDTVANMATTDNLKVIYHYLTAMRPDAFLFSGGGNDLCQQRQDSTNEFYDVLQGPPAAHGIQTKLLATYLDRVITGYRLILDVAAETRTPAFIHSYAHAIPSGRPALYKVAGPWLRPQLKAKGYDAAKEGPALVARMIDALSERLASLAKKSKGKVHFVDLRPVINAGDWHDELHLLPAGWKKAAAEFDKAIRKALGK